MHTFKCNKLILSSISLLGGLVSTSLWADNVSAKEEWKFTLKNAYINRNFENEALKDTGSWSQAASLFYNSRMLETPLSIAEKPLTIGVDASVQYAVRLSDVC